MQQQIADDGVAGVGLNVPQIPTVRTHDFNVFEAFASEGLPRIHDHVRGYVTVQVCLL